MDQRGFSSVLIIAAFLIFILGTGAAYYLVQLQNGSVSQTSVPKERPSTEQVNSNNKNTPEPPISAQTFVSLIFTVDYPANFYKRAGEEVSFTNKKWEGKADSYPRVGITEYNGDISGMNLSTWLEKVGTTKQLSDFPDANTSCKMGLSEVRAENDKVPYGGSDGKLNRDKCLYFGVKNFKPTDLKRIDVNSTRFQSKPEMVEFNSSNSVDTGTEETHTLLTFGSGAVWDIFMIKTNLSESDDGIEEAYKLLKDSFTIK